jgi:ribonuclease HI
MSDIGLPQVSLFVDGSCLGNPGVGGWAAILEYNGRSRELVGSESLTTNNQMELTAVREGLKVLKRACQVRVVTDSQYVANVLSGCQTKANRELVQAVRQLASQHQLLVQVVRGHSGHAPAGSAQAMNERCDRLAYQEARRRKVSHQ